MEYNKLPISISEQINKLKARGLRFDNEVKAKNILSNISYYRLRAYTFPFQDNTNENHPFNVDVSFEEIIELYAFDHQLRVLIFDAIEKIEIAFRTQLIHTFALNHGSHWQLNAKLFRDIDRHSNHIESLKKEIDRSKETFIDHYKNKYTNPTEPPCWMSLEVSSIGLLSKIFQNLNKGSEKNMIVSHFGLNNVALLENWMLCFSSLRNICAHHGRVWNRRLIKIKLPNNTKNIFLQNTNIYPNKLYAVLSCIAYILKEINPENNFSERLKLLLLDCPLAQTKEMGCPNDWFTEDIWN